MHRTYLPSFALWNLIQLLQLCLRASCQLDPTLMSQHLQNGAGILGTFSTDGPLTDWLAVFDDSTPIKSINFPGTHDSCAWNVPIDGPLLQCQDLPIFDQLNGGIRFFDIRFGAGPNGTLGLYHSTFLLDQTATLEDVLWGFYKFLDAHPTETVILSLKVDEGNTTSELQQTVFDMLTTSPVSQYWVLDADFGTLGEARHKAILFRRYTYEDSSVPFGVNVSLNWANNVADFDIPYDNASPNSIAWVEDYYELDLGNVTADVVVQAKLQAFQQHVENSASGNNASQPFVSFASGGGQISSEYVTPRILAVGDSTGLQGVNTALLPWFQQRKGTRNGFVLFDFFEQPENLVLAAIGSDKIVPNATQLPNASSTSTTPGETSRPIGSSTSVYSIMPYLHLLPLLLALYVLSS